MTTVSRLRFSFPLPGIKKPTNLCGGRALFRAKIYNSEITVLTFIVAVFQLNWVG